MNDIEAIIGRSLDEHERGTIVDLNRVPAALIGELQRLPRIMQHRLLGFYLDPASRVHVGGFLEEVVDGGAEVSQWRRGRVLAPSFTVNELMTTSSARLIERLGAVATDDVVRIVPSQKHRDSYGVIAGAPAILRPDLDYKYAPAGHLIDMGLECVNDLEPAGDVVIAFRRWIASRFVAKFGALLDAEPAVSPSQMLAQLFPGISVTPDARGAVSAVFAELGCSRSAGDRIPGFCGPDRWFEDAAMDAWIR